MRLFGPFEARVEGRPLPRLRSRKGQWLLALLALRPGAEVDRAWLASVLWPDSGEPQALAGLRNSLMDLRRALGAQAGRLQSPSLHTLRLDLSHAEVDVVAFDEAVARCRIAEPDEGILASLGHAVGLYRGPLLEGCAEEWVVQERDLRAHQLGEALERLAAHAEGKGDLPAAERWLRRAIVLDPARETVSRALMRVLAASGSYAAATQAYRDLRLLLHRELNAEPDPETRALYEQIRGEARERAGRGAVGAIGTIGRAPDGEGSRAFLRSRRMDGSGPPRADLLLTALRDPPIPAVSQRMIEAVGGAVPLDSGLYVVRPTDGEFQAAIARQDSIVLVKGARQMGKTSLLGRGIEEARRAGARVAVTDFQQFNAESLDSADAFFRTLGAAVADRLDLDVFPDEAWDARLGPSMNFGRYVRRHVLDPHTAPLVWGLDEVDLLLACDFSSEVFGLWRSWHNQRVTDPAGPWSRLTLVIAYATEAHLFIANVNQSPFNVGTRVTLEDFTLAEVADLNRRHGMPLAEGKELERFYRLVSGQPYLVRRGLYELSTRDLDPDALMSQADRDEGPFGDHLRRILHALSESRELLGAVCEVLQGRPCPTPESFFRLRSAGIIAGESARDARPRCPLYGAYLARHLL
jgi:DNA-binding SARP family transcriptional activator